MAAAPSEVAPAPGTTSTHRTSSPAAARAAAASPSGTSRTRGREVAEEERELVGRVGRVERRGRGAERAEREQQLDELRPVRQRQRDPISPLHAEPAELAGEGVDPLGELAATQRDAVVGRNERRPAGIPGRPDRRERLALHRGERTRCRYDPSAVTTDGLVELDAADLLGRAQELRERGHGRIVTFSPKVFIPLTKLCRDVCHYCTFAQPPKRGERAYMTADEVLAIAQAGAAAGCHEALFTLGDKPERRYRAAREELEALGCETTIEYLARMAQLVLDETGLLPHANPGVMSAEELALLRGVSASQGIMLETASSRLSERGGPHFGSPDKLPAVRLETLRLAGEQRIPFTSGILIGIGETRLERLEALHAIRDLHERYGHVQEVIVQNFRAKPGTKMHDHPEPPLEELLWTCAAARMVLGPDMNIQAPPNLSYDDFPRLLDAGINDWGGVSPVTIDHVNPEAPWPEIERLARATRERGLELAPRLPIYPEYVADDRGVVRAARGDGSPAASRRLRPGPRGRLGRGRRDADPDLLRPAHKPGVKSCIRT